MAENEEISKRELLDISELTDDENRDLDDLKNEIKEEIQEGGRFASSGWIIDIGDLYSMQPGDLTAYGRQRRRIYERNMPKETLERLKEAGTKSVSSPRDDF